MKGMGRREFLGIAGTSGAGAVLMPTETAYRLAGQKTVPAYHDFVEPRPQNILVAALAPYGLGISSWLTGQSGDLKSIDEIYADPAKANVRDALKNLGYLETVGMSPPLMDDRTAPTTFSGNAHMRMRDADDRIVAVVNPKFMARDGGGAGVAIEITNGTHNETLDTLARYQFPVFTIPEDVALSPERLSCYITALRDYQRFPASNRVFWHHYERDMPSPRTNTVIIEGAEREKIIYRDRVVQGPAREVPVYRDFPDTAPETEIPRTSTPGPRIERPAEKGPIVYWPLRSVPCRWQFLGELDRYTSLALAAQGMECPTGLFLTYTDINGKPFSPDFVVMSRVGGGPLYFVHVDEGTERDEMIKTLAAIGHPGRPGEPSRANFVKMTRNQRGEPVMPANLDEGLEVVDYANFLLGKYGLSVPREDQLTVRGR